MTAPSMAKVIPHGFLFFGMDLISGSGKGSGSGSHGRCCHSDTLIIFV
jgi:hypothetical protein